MAANFYQSFISWRDNPSHAALPAAQLGGSLNCFSYKTHNDTQLLLRVCSEMISSKLLLVSIAQPFNR